MYLWDLVEFSGISWDEPANQLNVPHQKKLKMAPVALPSGSFFLQVGLQLLLGEGAELREIFMRKSWFITLWL